MQQLLLDSIMGILRARGGSSLLSTFLASGQTYSPRTRR